VACLRQALLCCYQLTLADPRAWGYRKEASRDDPSQVSFVPVGDKPFKLHLVGKPDPNAAPTLPAALESVIEIHGDLSYDDFYRTIGGVVSGSSERGRKQLDRRI
jgi:hypothetical protein